MKDLLTQYLNINFQDIVDLSQIDLEEGESPLQYFIAAKGVMEALGAFRSRIEPLALVEAERLAGKTKTIKIGGSQIQIKELGTKWHYDKTNDPALPKLEHDLLMAKSGLEERQTFLKALTKPEAVVDQETGEMAIIYPAYKTSKTGIAISFQ